MNGLKIAIKKHKEDHNLIKILLAFLSVAFVVIVVINIILVSNVNNKLNHNYNTAINDCNNSYCNARYAKYKDEVKLEDLIYQEHFQIYTDEDAVFPRKTYILDKKGNIVTESEPYVYFENSKDSSYTYIFLGDRFTEKIKKQYLEFMQKADFPEIYKVEYNIVDEKKIASKIYFIDVNHEDRTTTLVLDDAKAEYVLEETEYPGNYMDPDILDDSMDFYFSGYNFYLYDNYNDDVYQSLINEFNSHNTDDYLGLAPNPNVDSSLLDSYFDKNSSSETGYTLIHTIEIGDSQYVVVNLIGTNMAKATFHQYIYDVDWLNSIIWTFFVTSCIYYYVLQYYEKNKRLENARIAFTSAAAHELKTPLAIIQNQCECVIEDVAPEKNKEYVRSVRDEAVRMNELVNSMLKYNRLSSTVSVEKEKFSLSELVAEEVRKYIPMADQKGIYIECNIQPDVVIKANRELIALAIDNYLSNAVKYFYGGRSITVTLKKSKYKTEFIVYNPCRGISYGDSPYLWEILYRQDKARTSSQGSTGMGLPICKQIFDLHGYKYGYINKPHGVDFYFKIKK